MERIELKAFLRKEIGKQAAKNLRRKGFIPAILYGYRRRSVPLSINRLDFKKIASKEENIIIDLMIEKDKKTVPAIVKEMQVHPVIREYLHVDFYEIAMDKEITLSIPIHLIGKSEGVKAGGIIEQSLREVEIRCLPKDIPNYIELDISGLNIGDSIHIKDIKLDKDMKILEDSDSVVVSIIPPISEEEPEAVLPEEEEIKVVGKKGKSEEEEEE
jgi:large subunit ribosomal protein L25